MIQDRHLKHGGKWIRQEKRLAIYLRDEFICLYCGRTLAEEQDGGELTLDHLRTDGGNHHANLITCCRPCNIAKGGLPLKAFASSAAMRRINAAMKKPVDVAAAKKRIAKKIKGAKAAEATIETLPDIRLPAKLMAEVGQTTDKRLYELAKSGKLPEPNASGYSVIPTLRGLLAVRDDTIADQISGDRARKIRAEADDAEMTTAKNRGTLMLRSENRRIWEDGFVKIRDVILRTPGISKAVKAELSAKLQKIKLEK